MENTEKFAYFLEEGAIRTVLPDWPEDMGAALCLDEAGGCEILVHHRDEGRAVLRRIAAVLKRPLGKFRVAPAIEGYPTRRVLFSEEQKLLSLLAGAEGLTDLADDYALNYRFALEEGLDPDAPEAPPARSNGPAAPITATRDRSRFPLGIVRRKDGAAPHPRAPLPPGYVLSSQASASECRFVDAQLLRRTGAIRLLVEPGAVTINTRPIKVAEIGLRDDFAQFVVPRIAFRGWKAGDPLVIDIPLEHFPPALVARFGDATRSAEVTLTRHGAFVALLGPVVAPMTEAEQPETPQPAPRPARRRRLGPVRKTAAVVLGVMALSGAAILLPDAGPDRVSEAANSGTAPDTGAESGSDSPRQAAIVPSGENPDETAALRLITAFARQEERSQ